MASTGDKTMNKRRSAAAPKKLGGGYGLGKRLWDECEAAQGFSFVSDDVVHWTDGQVLEFVQRNLANVRKIARTFSAINRAYRIVDAPSSSPSAP